MVAHDLLMKQFQAELKRDSDLTVSQYDALLRLTLAPGKRLQMGEVAGSLLFSSGAATKLFDRLVERGLVARSADPNDRRCVIVSLTDEGSDLIDRARLAHGYSIHDKIGPFASEDERRHVDAFLKRLATGHPATENPSPQALTRSPPETPLAKVVVRRTWNANSSTDAEKAVDRDLVAGRWMTAQTRCGGPCGSA